MDYHSNHHCILHTVYLHNQATSKQNQKFLMVLRIRGRHEIRGRQEFKKNYRGLYKKGERAGEDIEQCSAAHYSLKKCYITLKKRNTLVQLPM